MRVMQLILASGLFVALAAAPAHALTVTKKIAAPGDPTVVWAMAGDFCSIKDWHPLVSDCKQTDEGGATVRTLTLKDGSTIKEKLDASDDTSYSYEIIESPLPVKGYKAKFWVEPDERAGGRTTIFWQADFDANGASDEDAEKKVGDIFAAGLKSIKHKLLDQGAGDDSGDGQDTGGAAGGEDKD